jgi:pilus retraction protein PilT
MNEPQSQLSLSDLLKKLYEAGGSDLHITTNSAPQIRVHGHLQPLDGYRPLTSADTKQLAYSVLTDAQKHRFEENLELDFSFGVKGLSRFRANLFNQRGAVGAVFRAIPYEIKPFDELGLPPVVKQLCDKPRGLILVTGPTGSGKSTTLAAMVDKVNTDRHEHILTIEDPIEFLHSHKNCLVNQREVNADTHGFSEALRTALRQDPDVVLVGEMRDLETIESALRIAETGHLTFATLHTNSAASTINRIIDVFPSGQQAQIRAQLSLVLEGILCQALLPKGDGKGRAMALEILVPNSAIRNLIREDKVHQIYSMMQTGQDKYGMQTFNQSLATLYHKRLISLETAMQRSSNTDELKDLIERGSGLNTGGNGNAPRPGMPGMPQPPRPGVPPQQHPSPYAQPRPVGSRPGPR